MPLVSIKPSNTNEVSVKYDKEKDIVKYANEELTVKDDKDKRNEFEFVPLADATKEEETESDELKEAVIETRKMNRLKVS
ncbi:MAG: hypothetical protein IPJ32_20365 [Sphingobacteriaceae bacterium]|nr:hypothetical protein [Sphingobacteriaceae bacterium]